MNMRISIEAATCTGHGRCYERAPGLIDCDDDGRGVVVRAEVPPEQAEAARRAVGGCPERSVSITVA
jgi:ferredoxin